MAQARQIIGRKPDGTPIYGPPTSAPPVNASFERLLQPQAEVTVGAPMDVLSLQPSVPDAPQRGVVDTVRDGVSALKDWVSQDGIFGVAQTLAELAAGVAKDKLDRDIQIIQSVADATKRGVKWSGEFLSGLKEDVQGLTPESALSATDAFSSMFTGAERRVPAQNNRLDQAAAALGVIGSIMDPSPAGELKAARGLYSRVDDLVKLIPAKGAHPNRVLSVLKSGASGEELAYRGVPEFLAQQGNKPVTPAMLAEHLKANPAPMPQTKVLGKSESHFTLHSKHGIRRGIFPTEADAKAAMTEAGEYTLPAWSPDPPKYATYQVPGGENYRETLLTLPLKEQDRAKETLKAWHYKQYGTRFEDQTPEYQRIARLSYDRALMSDLSPDVFRSSHYPDDLNLLVHVRSNQRTLPNLGRGEFIEEVQSDWHQKGKKEGYGSYGWTAKPSGEWTPLTPGGWWNVYNQNGQRIGTVARTVADTPDQAIATVAGRSGEFKKGIPDAPFKDSWPELALKQKLLEVADDPNAQWIGFTGAGTQIKRYGTEQMTWAELPGRDGYTQRRSWRVKFEPQVGGEAEGIADLGAEAIRRGLTKDTSEIVHSQEELSILLGGSDVKAEKAWKRMQAAPEVGAYRPRAEGMTEFYDKQLVSKINKIIKPFGGVAQRVKMGEHYAWVVKLTPEMKVKILEAGLPLMSVVAATGAAQQQKREQ